MHRQLFGRRLLTEFPLLSSSFSSSSPQSLFLAFSPSPFSTLPGSSSCASSLSSPVSSAASFLTPRWLPSPSLRAQPFFACRAFQNSAGHFRAEDEDSFQESTGYGRSGDPDEDEEEELLKNAPKVPNDGEEFFKELTNIESYPPIEISQDKILEIYKRYPRVDTPTAQELLAYNLPKFNLKSSQISSFSLTQHPHHAMQFPEMATYLDHKKSGEPLTPGEALQQAVLLERADGFVSLQFLTDQLEGKPRGWHLTQAILQLVPSSKISKREQAKRLRAKKRAAEKRAAAAAKRAAEEGDADENGTEAGVTADQQQSTPQPQRQPEIIHQADQSQSESGDQQQRKKKLQKKKKKEKQRRLTYFEAMQKIQSPETSEKERAALLEEGVVRKKVRLVELIDKNAQMRTNGLYRLTKASLLEEAALLRKHIDIVQANEYPKEPPPRNRFMTKLLNGFNVALTLSLGCGKAAPYVYRTGVLKTFIEKFKKYPQRFCHGYSYAQLRLLLERLKYVPWKIDQDFLQLLHKAMMHRIPDHDLIETYGVFTKLGLEVDPETLPEKIEPQEMLTRIANHDPSIRGYSPALVNEVAVLARLAALSKIVPFHERLF